MKIMKLIWSLLFYMIRAGAQTFSCDASLSTPLCPGTVASCTCNATGTFAQTWWLFTTLNLQCSSGSNYIALAQCAPVSSGTCGPYLSAANNNPIGSSCPTSTLNITADPSLNGLVIECRDISSGLPGTLVGTKNISVLASPGSVVNINVTNTSVDQLTVTWAPPTTGGVPTSYNVSINDSSNTTFTIPANGPLQNTFTGLTSDILYTVSVVAINCAGTSSVTSASRRTLAAPPMGIQMVSVFNPNNTLRQFEISWTPVGGSVTMYTVRVVGNGASVGPTTTTCTTSPCLYVQQVYVPATSYTIFVASINGDGAVGPENSTTIYGAASSTLVITKMVFATNATIGCSFLNCQFSYCVVCCSSDPSVPAGSVGYLSSTSGPSVSVSLQSLGSNQMYYCKAAATNTNSASCVGPVVGGVKVFFSFMTPAMMTSSSSPSPSPSPSPSTSGSNIASIDTPTAVGITFAITFIISFSMGMLVASIILCVCYIPRVSSITTEASIPTTYEVVGINQKQTSAIELESNAAYGTAR